MYYLVAKNAVSVLSEGHVDHTRPQSEAEYFAACLKEVTLSKARADADRRRAWIGRFWPKAFMTWLAKGAARREERASLTTLLRSDPHLLRDLGIGTSGFGGLVLMDETDHGADMQVMPVAPAIPKAAALKPRDLPDSRLIRLARGPSPAIFAA